MTPDQVNTLFQLQRTKFVFEDIINAIYTSVVKPGDHVVDGGANIGDHTFPLAELVGDLGIVLAYEPVPATASKLREALDQANVSNVVLRQYALGREEKTSSFIWVENRATRSALKSPNLFEGARTQSIDVQVVRLDDEVRNREKRAASSSST